MCRNIKTLFNFEPPVTDEEVRAAAFLAAVDDVATISRNLLSSLQTNAPPRNRAEEAIKACARAAKRFPREHGAI